MVRRKSNTKTWDLRDVILTVLIAIIFGAIYVGWGLLWTFFNQLVGPIVGFLVSNNLSGALTGAAITQKVTTSATVGLWMMAGPLAAMIIKKPGAALFGETFASLVEMVIGSQWGIDNLIWGIVQGFGSEIGFALTGYKNYKIGLWLSVITGSVVGFAFNFVKYQYGVLNNVFVISLFVIFLLSVFFFAGVLVWLINKLLIKSKII